jgi:hypothetical protein
MLPPASVADAAQRTAVVPSLDVNDPAFVAGALAARADI